MRECVRLHREALSTGELSKLPEVSLYSIPAFDEGRAPTRVAGETIRSAKYMVPRECVLLSKLNPRIPRVWHVQDTCSARAVCSTEFWPLTARDGLVDHDFLAHYLSSRGFREHPLISPASTTKSHQRIDLGSFLQLNILLPPLPEQRKIAAILSSADDAIEKTQAVIDQVQVVKNGLMQELLTRGLPGRHKSFKKTEIGEIPQEWEFKQGETLFTLAGGYGPSSIRFNKRGDALFIKVDAFNLHANRSWIVESKDRFQLAENPGIKTFGEGSLVFAKRGAAIFKNRVRLLRCPTAVDPNLMVLTPRSGLDAGFFRYALLHRGLFNLSDNSGIPQLNNKHLNPARFPVPPPDEQAKIEAVLSAIDARIDREENGLLALESVKSALMSVLLTGEVRVKPDTEAA